MRSDEWHLYDAYENNIDSGNITFWTAMIREVIPPCRGDEIVLDYGCGTGEFLRLLNMIRPFQNGLGVDIDKEAISLANSRVKNGEPIKYSDITELDSLVEEFDYIFVQEVFWTIKDLPSLAKTLYRIIKDESEIYATMGCHIENPLWPHRRRLIQEEGMQAYDYSLDEVADIFYSAGFEVGLKRLPVDYFNIFHPKITRDKAQSLSKLVETTHENKMLFYFRKDEKWKAELESE